MEPHLAQYSKATQCYDHNSISAENVVKKQVEKKKYEKVRKLSSCKTHYLHKFKHFSFFLRQHSMPRVTSIRQNLPFLATVPKKWESLLCSPPVG